MSTRVQKAADREAAAFKAAAIKARRERALALLAKGLHPSRVARRLGMSTEWVADLRKEVAP